MEHGVWEKGRSGDDSIIFGWSNCCNGVTIFWGEEDFRWQMRKSEGNVCRRQINRFWWGHMPSFWYQTSEWACQANSRIRDEFRGKNRAREGNVDIICGSGHIDEFRMLQYCCHVRLILQGKYAGGLQMMFQSWDYPWRRNASSGKILIMLLLEGFIKVLSRPWLAIDQKHKIISFGFLAQDLSFSALRCFCPWFLVFWCHWKEILDKFSAHWNIYITHIVHYTD